MRPRDEPSVTKGGAGENTVCRVGLKSILTAELATHSCIPIHTPLRRRGRGQSRGVKKNVKGKVYESTNARLCVRRAREPRERSLFAQCLSLQLRAHKSRSANCNTPSV